MSRAIQCTECPDYFVAPSNVGFSPVSIGLMNTMKEQFRQMSALTITFEQPFLKAFKSLISIYKECCVPNWDGYDAYPLTSEALKEAWKFIQALPSYAYVPSPEIIAEPTGEIALEWRKGKRMIFVVSVSGKNKIHYAGLFGDSKINGTEYFGEILPSIISENLRRIYFY